MSGFDFSNKRSDNDNYPSNFTFAFFHIAFYVFLPFTLLVMVLIEPHAGPIKKRQREALKAFIMKKECDAVKESESLTKSEKKDFYINNALLDQGAQDCLYGLLELYGKIEAFETHLNHTSTYASQDDKTQVDGISAAAWRAAMSTVFDNAQPGSTVRAQLNAEEVEIAQMLFNAADLDNQHRITCTEFATLAVLLSATDAGDADAQVRYSEACLLVLSVHHRLQIELLCDMLVPLDEWFTTNPDKSKIDRSAVRSFVLSCLRSGIRLDLKPRKSAAGLVTHVGPSFRLCRCCCCRCSCSCFCFSSCYPKRHLRLKMIQCTQGMLDGLPVDLKKAGLTVDAGMIVLRERHKGNTWKAADTIVHSLFKAMDTENKGYILRSDLKEFFMHRLHPDLASHHTNSTTSHSAHTSTRRTTWDFNAVLQRARLKREERERYHEERSRRIKERW